MKLGITVAGYVAAGILFWLFIGAREDVAAAIEQCNVSRLSAIAETEKTVRRAIESASKARMAELESMVLDGQKAVDRAHAARMAAIVASNEQAIVINQLMRDADVEEIPDSSECLNVFIPASAVDRLRLHPRICRSPGSGRNRNSQVCLDPGEIDENDFPSGDFAEISFGDGLTLWGIDRSTIRSQNAQFEAIRTLNEDLE